MRVLISGILLLSTFGANAASHCDINTIIQHAWPDATRTAEGAKTRDGQVINTRDNLPQSAICRVWPAHPELTLAAVPLMQPDKSDDFRTGDLELLVLDSATLSVKQRLLLPDRMSDDSFAIRNVSLDTARWKIAPEQTAFGLRISRSASSSANPFYEDNLSLYVIENKKLRTLLKWIVLNDGSGEWGSHCTGIFNKTERTLAIENASHNGYADIRVSEKIVSSISTVDANDECQSKDKAGKTTTTFLRYDGKQYVVPKALIPLD